MNGKRKRKATRRESSLKSDQSYTDFLCPICLEILIEPVQMPCQHELCMKCFKTHVEDTSLTCPMCRLRISIWVRKNTKNNALVNIERWKLIQSLFPERVKRKLEGGDDFEESFSEYNEPKHIIACQGEVRREFEEQMKKIQDEENAVQQENLDYIRTIQEEERIEKQKQEELDQAAAHELQKQEMENLGVTLKSPTQHQKELLALLKPKSPMKLRQRVTNSSHSQKKSKVQRSILSSPNHTITNFFKKVDANQNNILERKLIEDTSPCSSKTAIDIDTEIARQLQRQFDEQWRKASSKVKPIQTRNQILTSHTLTVPLENVDLTNNLTN